MTVARVSRSVSIGATTDEVWDMVSRFDALPRWMPGIDTFAITRDGRKRTVISGDEIFIEQLSEIDHRQKTLRYSLVQSPLALDSHRATLTVTHDGCGGSSVEWSALIDSIDEDSVQMEEAVGGAFDAGLAGLDQYFASPVWARYPSLDLDEDSAPGIAGWLERTLLIPRCANCSQWHLPARPACPFCWSTDVHQEAVSGRGIVYLNVTLQQGPARPGVVYPYQIVTVELEEQAGLRFTSGLADRDAIAAIGTPVILEWGVRDAAPFPLFRPLGDAA